MRRLALGVLTFVAALALLGAVVHLAGAPQTVATLARLSGPELLALVATAFGVTLFSALAWQAILERDGHPLPLWLLFRLAVVAFAVGWAIPSGFVAGILAAAYFLRRRGVPLAHGLASFVIGRFFEITGFALILPAVLLSSLGSHATIHGLKSPRGDQAEHHSSARRSRDGTIPLRPSRDRGHVRHPSRARLVPTAPLKLSSLNPYTPGRLSSTGHAGVAEWQTQRT